MLSRRTVIGVWMVVGTVFVATPETKAQFSAFQQAFFRGSQFGGDPLFLSQPQNGPLFNFRQFTQRLEFNRPGDGYTYEFFRFFGPDSFNNPNTLDLGPLKVQLGPDPMMGQLQRTGVHGRVGFTTRIIPEVFFQTNTGQRTFNQFSGVTGFPLEPLKYRVSFDTGAQDFEFNGNILIDNNAKINVLGFYDFRLQLTNVGSFTADGAGVQDEQVTDFDVGPINVSGNILFDAIAGLFQSTGLSGAATTPRIFSAAAQRELTVDDLLAQLDSGQGLSSEEATFLINQMIITAFQNDPLGFITNGIPSDVPGFEALSLNLSEDQQTDPIETLANTNPEPGMLLLLMLAIGLSLAVRRLSQTGQRSWRTYVA